LNKNVILNLANRALSFVDDCDPKLTKEKRELFSNIYFNIQSKHSLPLHHIISILQKNNTWHQTSDDDAFLSDYC